MRNLKKTVLATVIVSAGIGADPSGAVAQTNDPAATQASGSFRANSLTTPRSAADPEAGRFGLGVIVGEPTAFTAKYWLSGWSALDLGLGWSFEDRTSFHLHGDFLAHKFDLFRIDRGELPLYLGVGARLKVPDHGENRVGIRVPVGIAYLTPDVPLEVFAELAPVIDVTPATQLKWNGGVGIRYYFK
jgi:hypothetical protein